METISKLPLYHDVKRDHMHLLEDAHTTILFNCILLRQIMLRSLVYLDVVGNEAVVVVRTRCPLREESVPHRGVSRIHEQQTFRPQCRQRNSVVKCSISVTRRDRPHIQTAICRVSLTPNTRMMATMEPSRAHN